MRSDQFVGLNNRAIEFLEKYAIKATHIIIVEGEIVSTEEKVHVMEGKNYRSEMYNDDVRLNAYKLKDGEQVEEYEQYCGYSSGEVHFIALMDSGGTPIEETLWTEKEIENNM